jgi:hypothetical protein
VANAARACCGCVAALGQSNVGNDFPNFSRTFKIYIKKYIAPKFMNLILLQSPASAHHFHVFKYP